MFVGRPKYRCSNGAAEMRIDGGVWPDKRLVRVLNRYPCLERKYDASRPQSTTETQNGY